jgi:hypothetical protein
LDREDHLKTGIIAVVLGIDVTAMAALGLGFDWASAVKVVVAWAGLLGLGWFYLRIRPDSRISHLMRETAHLVAFSAAGAVLSYVAATMGRPLVDEWLVAADRLMGFDWAGYVAAVNERPWLGGVSSVIYMSTLPQVAVAAVLLPLIGLTERSREFVLAVMLAALGAIAVSAILPSAGALAYFRPDTEFLAGNAPVVDLAYKQEFYRMRELAIPVLSLDGAKGLIAFPSYHVALSVLIALAFRDRTALFVPLAALNFGIILATPVDGGHHLSDAIGGAALALAALWTASRIRAAIAAKPQPSLAAGAEAPALLASPEPQPQAMSRIS